MGFKDSCSRLNVYMHVHVHTPICMRAHLVPTHTYGCPATKAQLQAQPRGKSDVGAKERLRSLPPRPNPTQPDPALPCPAPVRRPRRLPPGSTAAGSGPLRGGCGRGEKEEEEVVKEEDDDEEEEEKSDALRGPLLSTSPGRGSAGWVSWRRPDGSAAGSECEGEAGRGEERREDAPRGGRQGAGRRSGGR